MPEKIYRVDKFVVPSTAREEFLHKVRRTHAVLKAQPGFLQDFVLEQSSGPGEFNWWNGPTRKPLRTPAPLSPLCTGE